MIYIAIFILSIICIKLSFMTKNNKIISRFFEILAIIIPCLLAALRDYSIGTDVEVYVHPLFIAAQRTSSFLNFKMSMTGVTDILYLFITYICAHITKDIGLLFFILELLVILPIYISLKKRHGTNNRVILGMLLFYLFFYNQSFNMIRQSIAISFIILGLSYLDYKENFKFIISILIAILFHNTAIVFVLIFIIYKFLSSKKIDSKIKSFVEVIIIITGIVSIFYLPQIISLAGKIGILDMIKSETYLVRYVRKEVDVSYIHTTIYLFVLLIIFIYKKRIKSLEENANYYILSSVLSIIILQLGSVMSYAERIGYYIFYPILITIVPYIIYKENDKRIKNDFYMMIIVIIAFVLYWIVWIYMFKYNATVPYKFR